MDETLKNPEAGAILPIKIEKSKTRQKNYVMDLHIQSPASLGYLGVEGLDTAPALVRLAETKGLDVIAITDFCSGSYIDKIVDAASQTNLTVIPGATLRCVLGKCDDVILSCLFPETFRSSDVEEFLRGVNIPLIAAKRPDYKVLLPFSDIIKEVEARGGIVLPSRMDKTPHRMQMIPTLVDEYGFRAFDLAYSDSANFFKVRWPKVKFHLFSFSNANALAQVGSRIAKMKLTTPGFTGLKDLVSREA